jgi:preprotein translocase subunit YajC
MGTFETLGWLLLVAFMAFMFFYVLVKMIITERKRKSFITTVKVGDKIHTPVVNNSVDGEVIEIHDDSIVMKVIVPKSRVYPKK